MRNLKRRLVLLVTCGLLLVALALSAFTLPPAPQSSHADTVHCIHLYIPWRTVGVPAPPSHWVRHGRFCLWEPIK